MAKTKQVFRTASPYEEEMMRAKRQQQLAEMLQQQAMMPEPEPFTYQGFRAMPSPANALARILSAYTAKKVGEKAEESERRAREVDVAGAEQLRRELAPQARVAAPTTAEIAGGIGMPQISETGSVSYGPSVQAPTRTEMVGPTAAERRNIFANYAVTGTPTAQRLAQVLAGQEPKTQTMEFGDQLLNVTDGQAMPVMMGGRPVTAAPKTAEGTLVARLIAERDLLPIGHPNRKIYDDAINKETTKAAPSVTNINMPSEGERKDAYNLARVVNAASTINAATKTEPGAVKPGLKETAVSALPGVDEASYLAQSPQRQIVTAAQTDMIDALLTLATGAAYTKEQLEGQRAAILPRFGESKESIAAKKQRVKDLATAARIRAGRAWTPEMDKAIETAFGTVEEESIIDLPPRRR
jgi:hypothetical protein